MARLPGVGESTAAWGADFGGVSDADFSEDTVLAELFPVSEAGLATQPIANPRVSITTPTMTGLFMAAIQAVAVTDARVKAARCQRVSWIQGRSSWWCGQRKCDLQCGGADLIGGGPAAGFVAGGDGATAPSPGCKGAPAWIAGGAAFLADPARAGADAGDDRRCRLKFSHQRPSGRPIAVGRAIDAAILPFSAVVAVTTVGTVEPKLEDGSVVCQQLGELAAVEFDVIRRAGAGVVAIPSRLGGIRQRRREQVAARVRCPPEIAAGRRAGIS